MAIDERQNQRPDMSLPIRDGATYPTDCTCAVRRPGRTMLGGKWKDVCMVCGSLRDNTGT